MDLASAPHLGTLVDHLRDRRTASNARQIIGVFGAPGAGKSTVAEAIADELGPDLCVVVPMDGFHLANNILAGTPLMDRKGAIDTFDVGGYLALLRRLRAQDEPVVYAPAYRRGLEEPIAASIAVPRITPFVITEGNYLLADRKPWGEVRQYLDEAWFVQVPRDVRVGRLIERHVAFGKDFDDATAWALGPDETNAQFIESTRERADRVIDWS